MLVLPNSHWAIMNKISIYAQPCILGGGVLPEKSGGDVRPASQNPYPIYDQNLRYSLPDLWRDQKFETLFMP